MSVAAPASCCTSTVKKLGRIPHGRAGHRVQGQRRLQRNPRKAGKRQVGWEFVHV